MRTGKERPLSLINVLSNCLTQRWFEKMGLCLLKLYFERGGQGKRRKETLGSQGFEGLSVLLGARPSPQVGISGTCYDPDLSLQLGLVTRAPGRGSFLCDPGLSAALHGQYRAQLSLPLASTPGERQGRQSWARTSTGSI